MGEKQDEGIRYGGHLLKQRRSKLEIHLDVLSIIRSGVRKPTRIMYGANVSWKPLHRVLNSLIRQELVREIKPVNLKDKRTSVCYAITEKGENVLSYFKKAKTLLELESVQMIGI